MDTGEQNVLNMHSGRVLLRFGACSGSLSFELQLWSVHAWARPQRAPDRESRDPRTHQAAGGIAKLLNPGVLCTWVEDLNFVIFRPITNSRSIRVAGEVATALSDRCREFTHPSRE